MQRPKGELKSTLSQAGLRSALRQAGLPVLGSCHVLAHNAIGSGLWAQGLNKGNRKEYLSLPTHIVSYTTLPDMMSS